MRSFIVFLLLLPSIAIAGPQDMTPGIYTPGFFATPNYVKNPSCTSNLNNITASGGTLARTTSSPVSSIASCSITASASSQTYKFATRTFDNGLKFQNCEARFTYTGNASNYQAYVEQPGGTTVSQVVTLLDMSGTGGGKTVSLIFPCGDPANTTNVVIASTASGSAIKVGDVYAGLPTTIGSVDVLTDGTAYTPTYGAGFGTVSTSNIYYKRVGASLLISGTFVVGTAAASIGSFTLPTGLSIDTSRLGTTGNTTSADGTAIGSFQASTGVYGNILTATATSTTTVYFGKNNTNSLGLTPSSSISSNTVATGALVTVQMLIPISGWTSSALAVRSDQSNYDWTSYTPTATNFTLTSSDCWHKRDGHDLLIKCKIVVNTSSAAEARLSLPNNLVSDATIVPSIKIAGGAMASTTSSTGIVRYPMIESGLGYLTFAQTAPSTSGGMTKVNGNAVFDAGSTNSFEARVPISGWSENQKAPQLVGSVTSANSIGSEHIERAHFGGSGSGTSPTNCTSSPCTIYTQSGSWLTSITRSALGDYVLNIASGEFSDLPTCTFVKGKTGMSTGSFGPILTLSGTPSTTSIEVLTRDATNTAGDSELFVTCMGPR